MKYFVSVLTLFMMTTGAFAATGRMSTAQQMAGNSRIGMVKNQVVTAPTVSVSSTPQITASTDKSSVRVEPVVGDGATKPAPAPSKDMREKEKAACINNNIGIGNTFVWASRYSNTANYASMVEDTEEPANNTCFVKVELKSDDSKVSVADIPSKYFVMGQTITCGAWADEDALEKRILDAKKSARTWATVGGVVGGAGIGVGAMELFGNKLIGGAVEGQKALVDNKTELWYSQLSVLKKNQDPRFNTFMDLLAQLKTECENSAVWGSNADKPSECTTIDYKRLLSLRN